jgi:hypothetical protein
VGLKAGLDAVMKRKIRSPCRNSNPQSSKPVPSAIPLSYPGSNNNKCRKKIRVRYRIKVAGLNGPAQSKASTVFGR